jgi:hypothetical protein
VLGLCAGNAAGSLDRRPQQGELIIEQAKTTPKKGKTPKAKTKSLKVRTSVKAGGGGFWSG